MTDMQKVLDETKVTSSTPGRRERPSVLTVTPEAARKIKELLKNRQKPSLGVRVGVRSKGCSGLAYTLEFVDEKPFADEVVETHDVTIFIDPKAVLFLAGSEMQYEEEKLQSGFTFKNPNEKGRCGCGESFHV